MDNNKVEELVVGQIFKNYKQLCEFLGEKINGGKGKQLQTKDWERYFSSKRNGHKYIIEEIYEEPKTKIDKRKNGNNNNDIYGEIIQELIMDMLIRNNGKLLYPLGFFLNEICMTNQNYSHYQYNHPELAELLNIEKFDVYYFYLTSNSNFRGIFERSLANLVKGEYLTWEKVTMISSGYSSHAVATSEEQRIIQQAKEKVLIGMGYKNIQKIILAGKYKIYQEKIMEIIIEKIEGIDYFYSSYLIRAEMVDYKNRQTDIDVLKFNLNGLIIENLDKQAKNRQLATLKKYEVLIGKPRKLGNQFDECKISDDYLEINRKLVSILVNRDTKYIGNLKGYEKVKRIEKYTKLKYLSPLIA